MDPTLIAVVTDQTENYWNFVGAGYGVAAVAIGGYVVHLVRRGRKLSRQVPPEERRWL